MSARAPRLAAGLLILFALTAALVIAGATASLDAALLAALRRTSDPGQADVAAWIVASARLLTHAGTGIVRAPLAIGAALVILAAGHRRAAGALVAGWAGESLLVELLKRLVARPRPDLPWRLVSVHAPSFPSGHAAGTMLLYPLLGLFLGRLVGARAGRIGAGLGIAIALAVGATRVLLGVHWGSDVLAGWLLGGAIAAFAARAAPPARG